METHRQGPAGVDSGLRTMGAADNVSSKKCFAVFKIKVHPYPFGPEVGTADPSWPGEPRNPAGATDATQKALDLQLPLPEARFSLAGGTVSKESGGHVRERTGHSRRDGRDPWQMRKTKALSPWQGGAQQPPRPEA